MTSTNRLTVLIDSDNRRSAAKRFRVVNGETISRRPKPPLLVTWDRITWDDSGLWLRRMRKRRDAFIVLGDPVPDWPKDEPRRRLLRPRDGDDASLIDAPRSLMPIDIDKLPFEPKSDITDGHGIAVEAMDWLGLSDIRAFWHLTGSHGVEIDRETRDRLRLWIVLEEPADCVRMKAFARSRWDGLVDMSVYRPNQPIYTADPLFGSGLEDPIVGHARSGVVEGEPFEMPAPEKKRRPGRPRKEPFDKVREALTSAGLYISPAGDGMHFIDCPWEADHSGESVDEDTVYLEAGTNGYEGPGFKCHHDHCAERESIDFLRYLGLDRELTVEDFHFVASTKRFVFIPTRGPFEQAGINAVVRPVKVGDDTVSASAWIMRHRNVTSMTWYPGRDMIIEGEAWTENGPVYDERLTTFNTYMRPVLSDGDPSKAQRYLDHVHKVYPDDADHILDYLAHLVQEPQVKINHGIVLDGAPGIGKDTILVPVRHAVGVHNCESITPQAFMGPFNRYLRCVLLVINEARDTGESKKYQLYEHSKIALASPPEHLRINEKNLGEYYVPNLCGVVITTNSAQQGLYLPVEDRRHYAAGSPLRKGELSDDYFKGLYRWMLFGGGNDHVAAYLMGRDIWEFDPYAPPKQTALWWSVVEAGTAEEDVELAVALEELGWPDALTLKDIESVLPRFSDLQGMMQTASGRKSISYRLGRLQTSYIVIANPDAKDGVWKTREKKRVKVYCRRDMTFREQIKAVEEHLSNAATRSRDDDW